VNDRPATTIALADVIVGKRHRLDMGDIDAFAARIAKLGLIQPIAITPDRTLIDGGRRLEAYKRLGRTEIPVHVIPLDEIVSGEFAANVDRKDFLPSEIVAIKRALGPKLRVEARERQGGRRDIRGISPQVDSGRAADKVAAFVGKDRRTVEKAEAIVKAAEADPQKFGKLVEDMDRTGRVDGPHRRLKVMRQAEAIRAEPPPYPNKGPYRVVVADPPWPYELRQHDPSYRGVLPYTSMRNS
jgi:ParB-like chromosome segregation protein Spo0J